MESGAGGGPLAGPLTQNIAEADRSQSRDCDVSLLVREGLGVRPALEVAYIYTHNVPLPLLFRLLN